MAPWLATGLAIVYFLGFIATNVLVAFAERVFKASYRRQHADSPPSTFIEEIDAMSRGRWPGFGWDKVYRTTQGEPAIERLRQRVQITRMLRDAWLFGGIVGIFTLGRILGG